MNPLVLVFGLLWFGGYWGFSLLASQETVREGRARSMMEARIGGRWLGNSSARGKVYRNLAIAWVVIPVLIVASIAIIAGLRGR